MLHPSTSPARDDTTTASTVPSTAIAVLGSTTWEIRVSPISLVRPRLELTESARSQSWIVESRVPRSSRDRTSSRQPPPRGRQSGSPISKTQLSPKLRSAPELGKVVRRSRARRSSTTSFESPSRSRRTLSFVTRTTPSPGSSRLSAPTSRRDPLNPLEPGERTATDRFGPQVDQGANRRIEGPRTALPHFQCPEEDRFELNPDPCPVDENRFVLERRVQPGDLAQRIVPREDPLEARRSPPGSNRAIPAPRRREPAGREGPYGRLRPRTAQRDSKQGRHAARLGGRFAGT